MLHLTGKDEKKPSLSLVVDTVYVIASCDKKLSVLDTYKLSKRGVCCESKLFYTNTTFPRYGRVTSPSIFLIFFVTPISDLHSMKFGRK